MNVWNWFEQCRRDYLAKGDQQRLQLTTFYSQAYDFRETDPARALALFTEGRRLAEQLGEPWWVVFYDKFRVDAQVHFQRDFRQVLDLAVQCTLEVRKPAFAHFPQRLGVYDSLVAVYLGIDAEGYAQPIQEALNFLEQATPHQPDSDRFLLLARKRIFALERQAWEEARAACWQELALADTCTDASTSAHFASFVYCGLCQIAGVERKWREVEEYAHLGEENARKAGHQCELAECLAWQAAALRHAGEEDKAQRVLRGALARSGRLGMPPKQGYFDALAAFYLQGDNLPGALQVRERELAAIVNHGRLLYECRVKLERYRLLSRIGAPFDEHLGAAREEATAAARRLRMPEKYLREIEPDKK